MELAVAINRQIVVGTTFEHWLAGQLSDHTRKAYSGDIQQFLDWFGSRDLTLVCRDDIHRYRAYLVKTYKPATINRKLSSIRQLFKEAVLQGMIDSSPAQSIKGHKIDAGHSSTKAPSVAQVRALLDSVSGVSLIEIRDQAIIYITAGMGLRRQEVVDLVVSDIQQDQGYTVLSVRGKGNKVRRLPFPPNVLAAVRVWIDAAKLSGSKPIFQGLDKVGCEYILSGKALHPNGIAHILKVRMNAVGIEGCSPHSLRHYCITDIIRNGCDIYKAQKWAGHSDPRTTERYDRAHDDLANSAANFVRI